jgi:acylpyruvate hydrolase
LRLATIRTASGTAAVRVDRDAAVELGEPDVGRLLGHPDWRDRAAVHSGVQHPLATLDYAPVVPAPEKIICVGLNYRSHIREMGRDLPEVPTLFAKFARAQVGANDPIELPPDSAQMDWEGELGVYVGATVRHASHAAARAAIAGYTVVNDVTARDFQYRSVQWLQGKTLENSTPVGPWLVTDTEPGELTCEVDGDVVQKADTSDLVFGAVDLISHVSRLITLVPGDLILTGTPGGVGHARKPPRYLAPGSRLTTRIEGVGECVNTCVQGGQHRGVGEADHDLG